MKENKEKIDSLIEKNAAKQFSQINWEQLNTAISSRLDKAQQKSSSSIIFPGWLKIAASIAVIAATIFTVITILEKPQDIPPYNYRTAEVKFAESKGRASVHIQTASANSKVTVELGNKKELAKCDVEIIDMKGGLQESSAKATWIIISRPQPIYADNEINQDMMDIMYLF